jgi:hypothetical protein
MVVSSCENEEDDDLLLRRLIPCEEDRRRLFAATAWTGGYRWFRSPNVIDLEVRRKAAQSVSKPVGRLSSRA